LTEYIQLYLLNGKQWQGNDNSN